MTYYSDLLIIIDEIDALKHGLAPRHGLADLRRLCASVLAIDPAEQLASDLLLALRDLDGGIAGASIRILLFEKVRSFARLSGIAV